GAAVSNRDMASFSRLTPSLPSPVMARVNAPRAAVRSYADAPPPNNELRHSRGVTLMPLSPLRPAPSSTLARLGALPASLTSSMLSNSFGSWAALTSRSSGAAELVAGGGDVATVEDRSGHMPTTAQMTSAATVMRMNA